MGIQRLLKDSSPYVRRTAAHAIPKVYRLDKSTKVGYDKSTQYMIS